MQFRDDQHSEFERRADAIVDEAFRTALPEVLYHYASCAAAEGILRSNVFWASAHDCMNDPAELLASNDVVLSVAKELRSTASGRVAEALDVFLANYSRMHLSKMLATYLMCFSIARDDRSQWCNYGDHGNGICLGVR
jgi:hypothetical protein